MHSPLHFFVKLLVRDLLISAAFYEGMGFQRVGSDGTHLHLRWEEQGDVLLVQIPDAVVIQGKRGWGVLLGFVSRTPLDSLAQRASACGAVLEGPHIQPWHTRELVVVDVDGYRLTFVEPA